MTREEAIHFADLIDSPFLHTWEKQNKALHMAIEALSAEAGWIPCSERLPEKDDLVLATVWNDVVIAWRNRYGGWESAEDVYEKGDVIAWMPLPKPYKGGDDK